VFDNLNSQVHGISAEKPLYLHKDAEFVRGDMRERDSLRKAIEGIDIIIHDAAEVGVGQSMYSIDQYISTNVGGTGVLWDILVNVSNNVEKVLVASSMSNYGEGRYVCRAHGKISPKPRPVEQMQADNGKCFVRHADNPQPRFRQMKIKKCIALLYMLRAKKIRRSTLS